MSGRFKIEQHLTAEHHARPAGHRVKQFYNWLPAGASSTLIRTRKPRLFAGLAMAMSLALAACASSSVDEPAAIQPAAIVANTPVAATPVAIAIPVEAQQRFEQALTLLKNGEVAAATPQLQALAAAYPTFAAPLINLGLIALKAGHYESAGNYFKDALARDAKSAVASNYLGVSYRYLGRFKDAEAAYQAAITADDNYAIAHLNLGVLYDLYLQQPLLALNEYQRYQSLLSTPDAKVAGWIKELTGRLNAEKRAKPATSEAAP